MPLLAPADQRILRELLAHGGTAELSEISAGAALDHQTVQASLGTLRQSGIVVQQAGAVPGLRGTRWSLTQRGRDVGPSLVAHSLAGAANANANADADADADAQEMTGPADRAVTGVAGPPPSSRRRVQAIAAGLLVVATVGVGVMTVNALRATSITVAGISDGALLRPSQLAGTVLEFTVSGGNADSAQVRLDGLPTDGVQRYDNRVVWPVPELAEGIHVISFDVDRRLFGTAQTAVSFTIDGTPPAVDLPRVYDPVALGEPVVLTGTVEAGVTLRIGEQQLDTASGAFSVTLPSPPRGPLPVTATDAAGNTTAFDVIVPVSYPHTTGVHVTAAAWDHDGLRSSVLELIEQGRINAVQLDLKDEDGRIGHRTDVRLAQLASASQELYNLRDAIAELHDLGVRVIGRIVAFRDPTLARYATENGNLDWVLQTPDGRPLANYGGFTNFNHPVVRQYNLDLAAEAAEAGIDDVLWDYMRRPEGDLDAMRIPGWNGGDPSPAIASFLAEAALLLREQQVFHGVSVFGIAADRGEWVAQDIGAMSAHVDYVAPMVYPSHWGPGEYGVTHPEAQPYDITRASLAVFQRKLADTNTAVVPWLQDFSMRVAYGPAEVRAQIDAAADLGITDWLLWDPKVTYTNEGMPVAYR